APTLEDRQAGFLRVASCEADGSRMAFSTPTKATADAPLEAWKDWAGKRGTTKRQRLSCLAPVFVRQVAIRPLPLGRGARKALPAIRSSRAENLCTRRTAWGRFGLGKRALSTA